MMRTFLRSLVTLIIVAVAIAAGFWLWHYYLYTPWTRDGRVRADVVTIAPDVSGRVVALPISDNQTVAKGEILFRIDDTRYQAAQEKAQAMVQQRKAELELSQHEASRRSHLSRQAISAESQETAQINSRVAAAQLGQAQSALHSAQIDLERTTVQAPADGHVLNLQLAEGNYVNAGNPVMALVKADSFYVTGYFEETKTPHIQVGDPADHPDEWRHRTGRPCRQHRARHCRQQHFDQQSIASPGTAHLQLGTARPAHPGAHRARRGSRGRHPQRRHDGHRTHHRERGVTAHVALAASYLTPSSQAVKFAVKATLAMLLALYIALWCDLERPYWALISAAFLQIRPMSGMVVEKGLSQIIGTVIGCAAGIVIMGSSSRPRSPPWWS